MQRPRSPADHGRQRCNGGQAVVQYTLHQTITMHVMRGKMLSKQFNHLFVHGSATQSPRGSCHNMGTRCHSCRPSAAAHTLASTHVHAFTRSERPCHAPVLFNIDARRMTRQAAPYNPAAQHGSQASAHKLSAQVPNVGSGALPPRALASLRPSPDAGWPHQARHHVPWQTHCRGHQDAAAPAPAALRPACRWRRPARQARTRCAAAAAPAGRPCPA